MEDELDLFARLVRWGRLPPDLRDSVCWHYQRALALEHFKAQANPPPPPRQFAYVGEDGGDYQVNGVVFRCQAAGAAVLARAVLNPDRWLRLPRDGGRSIRAWHASITAVVEHIRRRDAVLADALAIGPDRDGPGSHLRVRDGRIELIWIPGNVSVTGEPVRHAPPSLWNGPGSTIEWRRYLS